MNKRDHQTRAFLRDLLILLGVMATVGVLLLLFPEQRRMTYHSISDYLLPSP